MNDKKQIEDIAKILNECCNEYDEQGNHLGNKCASCEYWSDTNHVCVSYNTKEAEALYNVGYRKQSEGEWATKDLNNPLYESKKAPHCSNCEYMSFIRYDYCPNCGAKMKRGIE